MKEENIKKNVTIYYVNNSKTVYDNMSTKDLESIQKILESKSKHFSLNSDSQFTYINLRNVTNIIINKK